MKIGRTLLLLALCTLAGCAPSLPAKVNVSVVPDVESKILSNFNDGDIRLSVDPFVDSRKEAWIAEVVGERQILPDSDVGIAVQQGFKQAIQKSGVRTPLFDSPKLAGEVLDWNVRVDVSFPTSKAKAAARLKVYLLDSQDNLLYTGTYEGSSEVEHPYIENHIESTLGEAMASAIQETLSDTGIINLLSTKAQAVVR